jgi:SAM-dependent methyltransferase
VASREHVARALLAVAGGDRDGAVRHARLAAESATAGAPAERLATALVRHLSAEASGGRPRDVYAGPEAFQRFIDGGGNVDLYAEATQALAAIHQRDAPRAVLDVGCGDGRLTVASLRPGLARLDLVEPSGELLAAAQTQLAGQGPTVVPHCVTAQAFVGAGVETDQRWDLAQATFALHAVPPADRGRVLGFLAGRVRRLVVLEFDVPDFADGSAEHAFYAAEHYEAGIAEYPHDELVVDGFLVPVLVGQFDPGRPRHTWEQPAAAWDADLRAAGFGEVRDRVLSDYWWAPAHVIDATPG